MPGHVSEELLQRFASGDIGEELAVQIATHLDGCSVCNAQAQSLDPLHAYYASWDEPPVPDHLVGAILEDAEAPQSEPWLPGLVILVLAGCVSLFAHGVDSLHHTLALCHAGVLAGLEWMSGASHMVPLSLSVCMLCCAIAFTHTRQKRAVEG